LGGATVTGLETCGNVSAWCRGGDLLIEDPLRGKRAVVYRLKFIPDSLDFAEFFVSASGQTAARIPNENRRSWAQFDRLAWFLSL